MKITFSNDFRSIANAGDAQDVYQTVQNFKNAVEQMILKMYPDADVIITDGSMLYCTALVDGEESEKISEGIVTAYLNNEFAECWA